MRHERLKQAVQLRKFGPYTAPRDRLFPDGVLIPTGTFLEYAQLSIAAIGSVADTSSL